MRLEFTLDPGCEDRLAAEMWSLGTLGLRTLEEGSGGSRIEAYFPFPASDQIRSLIHGTVRFAGVSLNGVEEVPGEDWLAAYRASAVPIEVGPNLIVDPREPDGGERETASGSRWHLRIPARQAFGIGSHATTRLMVSMLESVPLRGRKVIDVGTGTGILAMYALLLGARSVVGIDLDPLAVFAARDNARLNGVFPALAVAGAASVRNRPVFDLALVNILPDRVIADIEQIAAALNSSAAVLMSGMLEDDGDRVVGRWRDCGFTVRQRWLDEGWVGVAMQRVG